MELARLSSVPCRPARPGNHNALALRWYIARGRSGVSPRPRSSPLMSLIADVDVDLTGCLEVAPAGQLTVSPTAEEVMMLQRSVRLLATIACITACMTAAATLWLGIVHAVLGSVPAHTQLMFTTASQLLSGAWVGCWFIYTVLGWRFQQMNAFRAGCAVLMGLTPPLMYCCSVDPSTAVSMMFIGMVTFSIRPALATCTIGPSAAELLVLQQRSKELNEAVQVATPMTVIAGLWALVTLFLGAPCPSASPTTWDIVSFSSQVMQGVWVLLMCAYTAMAGRFKMIGPCLSGCTALAVLMLPMAYFSFLQPRAAPFLMIAALMVYGVVVDVHKEAYCTRHQQLSDDHQRGSSASGEPAGSQVLKVLLPE